MVARTKRCSPCGGSLGAVGHTATDAHLGRARMPCLDNSQSGPRILAGNTDVSAVAPPDSIAANAISAWLPHVVPTPYQWVKKQGPRGVLVRERCKECNLEINGRRCAASYRYCTATCGFSHPLMSSLTALFEIHVLRSKFSFKMN